MEKEIEIVFDYEYNCGGNAYSRSAFIPQDTFNKDTLLILVCSYIHSECCYPGAAIDQYLHNKFPNVHGLDEMADGSIYNVFDCHVEGLKSFKEVSDGLLCMTYAEAEKYVEEQCNLFNESQKGTTRTHFSIWNQ